MRYRIDPFSGELREYGVLPLGGVNFHGLHEGIVDPLAGIPFALRLQTHKREIWKRDTVTVSGAGTAAANGDYDTVPTPIGGIDYYYKRDGSDWRIADDGDAFRIQIANVANYYEAPISTYPWGLTYAATGTGVAPAPTVTFTANKPQYLDDGTTPIYKPLGLYEDVACTIPATEEANSLAAGRDELSGSGVVVTQSNSIKRPTLAFADGVPVIRCDGADDFLAAAFAAGQPMTVFIGYKNRAVGTGGVNDVVFDGYTGNGGVLAEDSSPQTIIYAGAVLGVAYNIASASFVIAEATFNGASSSLYVDGALLASGSAELATMDGITIGAFGGGLRPTAIDVVAVMMIAGPTDEQRVAIRQEIATLLP